jgi:hypothetical protein
MSQKDYIDLKLSCYDIVDLEAYHHRPTTSQAASYHSLHVKIAYVPLTKRGAVKVELGLT